MKKFFVCFLFIVFLYACGGGGTKSNKSSSADISKNPDYQAGLAIASKSNCFTCHNIEEKVTGPSYREIANKYANAPDTIIDYLADKIISGGGGVWGEIPMVPHPEISKEDARKLAKYVLLLKK